MGLARLQVCCFTNILSYNEALRCWWSQGSVALMRQQSAQSPDPGAEEHGLSPSAVSIHNIHS